MAVTWLLIGVFVGGLVVLGISYYRTTLVRQEVQQLRATLNQWEDARRAHTVSEVETEMAVLGEGLIRFTQELVPSPSVPVTNDECFALLRICFKDQVETLAGLRDQISEIEAQREDQGIQIQVLKQEKAGVERRYQDVKKQLATTTEERDKMRERLLELLNS